MNLVLFGGGKDCFGNNIELSICDVGICVGKCLVVFLRNLFWFFFLYMYLICWFVVEMVFFKIFDNFLY